MRLANMSVKEFVDEVASSSPAPGGGSVSALAGADGCGLYMMAGQLTVGKKKFKALSEIEQNKYKENLEIFATNKERFIELIDLDTEAFNELMEAMKLPKETDDEIKIREKAMDKATLFCIRVPMQVAALGLESLRVVPNLIDITNKNTISDQGVGVLMLHAAVEGAAMNVLINLPGVNDESLKKEFKKTINEIMNEANKLKDSLLEKVKYLLL